MTSELREALCLAALTYGGFEDARLGLCHDTELARVLRTGLAEPKLREILGKWELLWGPASYRGPVSLVDDVAAWVVRRVDDPDRYVLAIRGTNPISPFDWLFGDLWVAKTVPWPDAKVPGAEISLSTALGLAIVRGLRSGPPREKMAPGIWDLLPDSAKRATHSLVTALSDAEELALSQLRRLVFADRVPVASSGAVRSTLAIGSLVEHWAPNRVRQSLAHLDEALGVIRGAADLALLTLLEGDAALRARFGAGVTLTDFLRTATRERGINLTVVGHSKGGALAPTVALWLADTQGEPGGWDPSARSRVRCISFAGPTAGNTSFASHSDAKLGANMTRVRNPRDVVPRAWDELGRVPALYGPRDPLLAELVRNVLEVIGPIKYAQIASPPHDLESQVRENVSFASQVVYQHLEAYLRALGVDADTFTFFNPLA